ncbi:TPA: hypothetical protein I6733_003597, partial [Vibrio cholerae]|nr:hypothetical protein [Vibrio cholerae]HDP8490385.1 hypothetical protein [Vibrio cholerae]
MVLDVCLQDA